jgi:HSP20 family protein
MTSIRFSSPNRVQLIDAATNHWFNDVNAFFERASSHAHAQSNSLAAVDVAEFETKYEYTVNLPGFTTNEIDVETKENHLTISAKKSTPFSKENKTTKEEKKDAELEIEQPKYHLKERTSGDFERSFKLPNFIDAEAMKAEFKDGVLTINLPKSQLAKPRKLEIATS